MTSLTLAKHLTLVKHHGQGNDFLILLDLDATTPIDAAMVRALCDRHRGIGADGLIRATRPAAYGDDTAFVFELRNADGGPAEMSGNGLRCLGQAALDAGLVGAGTRFVVATAAGPRGLVVRRGDRPTRAWASAEMGAAVIDDGDRERCNVGHGQMRVNMGNPHLVVLGPDPAVVAVDELGPVLARSVAGGQNVEFVALGPGPDEITMRIWERGVGETLACGTGACAAVTALHHWGRVGSRVTVHQPGGDADVELRSDAMLVLSGPVERVGVCLVEVDGAPIGAGVSA